jgi:hypothetical protein
MPLAFAGRDLICSAATGSGTGSWSRVKGFRVKDFRLQALGLRV